MVNSRNGLAQQLATEKRRQNLRGTAGSTETCREVIDFITTKGERGKRTSSRPTSFGW